MHNLCFVSFFCRELTTVPKYFLPFSCQSTSLGDKVCRPSAWLFGACLDWHVALKLQKSALRCPGDTTCLAQGTFVRSIFISWLFSQPISPGHSVRHHLSLTVKLSGVCVRACMCVCTRERDVHLCVCLGLDTCHMSVPRTILGAGDSRMSWEDECFLNIGGYHYSYLDWFAESQSLDVKHKTVTDLYLNMLLIKDPQSIIVKVSNFSLYSN